MVGIDPTENVAGVLDDGVLKSTTCTKEGNPRFPGVTDGKKCAVHAAVRRGGDAPDAIESRHGLDTDNPVSGKPLKRDGQPQQFPGGLQ